MLNCIIVDDELASIEIISDYIAETEGLKLLKAITKPSEVLSLFAGGVKPDITFLDIQMPGINGLDLAEIIKGDTAIVFITSHPQYAVKSYEQEAFDYLMKPISYKRFLQAVSKVQKRLTVSINSSQQNGYFFIKTAGKGERARLECANVLYAESLHNYVQIYTSQRKYTAYLTMKELLEKLNQENFIRIHKSTMVNIEHITRIDGNTVTMSDNTEVQIGRAHRPALMELLDRKTFITDRKPADA